MFEKLGFVDFVQVSEDANSIFGASGFTIKCIDFINGNMSFFFFKSLNIFHVYITSYEKSYRDVLVSIQNVLINWADQFCGNWN